MSETKDQAEQSEQSGQGSYKAVKVEWGAQNESAVAWLMGGGLAAVVLFGIVATVWRYETPIACVLIGLLCAVRYAWREVSAHRYANRPFDAEELASIASIKEEMRSRRERIEQG